jgi:hypothetical protein
VAEHAAQAVGPHVADQGALGLECVALEPDAEQLAHGAPTAVAAHQVVCADRSVTGCRGDARAVLAQPGQLGVELDRAAQLGEPVGQDPVGPPLRDQPGVPVRRRRVAHQRRHAEQLGQAALPHHLVPGVQPELGERRAAGPYRVDHAQVVEHLQRARLQPLGAGALQKADARGN